MKKKLQRVVGLLRGGAVCGLLAFAASAGAAPLAIVNGTLIDGTGAPPVRNAVIVVDNGRIVSVGAGTRSVPKNAQQVDVAGKYVIPGMMDANAHLVYDISPEFLLTFESRFTDIGKEAAQVALKAGVTTLFDTWGPLEIVKAARDSINRGEVVGSRVFFGGNMVGVAGPLTPDFYGKPDGLRPETIDHFNAMWEQGVGHDFLYMTPEQVREHFRRYLDKGVDFVKIAVSGHGHGIYGMLNFTPEVLHTMIAEAHARGLLVITHTMTVESLRMFAEGEYALAQHCSTTLTHVAPDDKQLTLIPDSTIKKIVDRKLSCSLNAYTEMEIRRRINDPKRLIDIDSPYSVPRGPDRDNVADVLIAHQNEKKLIKAGVKMLMVTDAGIPWIDSPTIHRSTPCWMNKHQCLHMLGEGHIAWLRAMQEKGMAPMEMLKSATSNVAAAYGKPELGTLEKGKIADLVVLDGDPLADVENYGAVHLVMKDGVIIDRDALPTIKVLTPLNAPHLAGR